jgi:hypothetical protein
MRKHHAIFIPIRPAHIVLPRLPPTKLYDQRINVCRRFCCIGDAISAKKESLSHPAEAFRKLSGYFLVALPSMNGVQFLPSIEISYFSE